MESFVRRFIRASLIWLGIGVSLGIWMIFDPSALAYRAAHMHANLLGFVSMMIFGVAYHIMPRFTGRPLASPRAATLHLIAANAGLALMVLGFMLRFHFAAAGAILLRTGGIAAALGVALFISNIWRTLGTTAVATQITPIRSARPQSGSAR